MGLKVGAATLHVELIAGQMQPQEIARDMAEVWHWMASGRLETRGRQETGADEMQDQMIQMWHGMQHVLVRDFGLNEEEARQRLAARCGLERGGQALHTLQGRDDWSWVVAQAALAALRDSSPHRGEPTLHDHLDLTRLWLVACRDAGVMFMSPQEALVRLVFFGPAFLGGWMSRPSWFGVRGSVNRPFDGLGKQSVEVVCVPYDSQMLGQVHAYGLTHEGYGLFRTRLQQAGLLASALDRMAVTLGGGRLLPATYPDVLLADPDVVLEQEGPR